MTLHGEDLSISLVPQIVPQINPSIRKGETVVLTIKADKNGELASIQFEGKPPVVGDDLTGQLQKKTVQYVNIARGAGQTPPEFDLQIDGRLRYEFVIRVVNAVCSQMDENGHSDPFPISVPSVVREPGR